MYSERYTEKALERQSSYDLGLPRSAAWWRVLNPLLLVMLISAPCSSSSVNMSSRFLLIASCNGVSPSESYNIISVSNTMFPSLGFSLILVNQSINQSITGISLVGAISHEGVNRRRQWMAVSGMTCGWSCCSSSLLDSTALHHSRHCANKVSHTDTDNLLLSNCKTMDMTDV